MPWRLKFLCKKVWKNNVRKISLFFLLLLKQYSILCPSISYYLNSASECYFLNFSLFFSILVCLYWKIVLYLFKHFIFHFVCHRVIRVCFTVFSLTIVIKYLDIYVKTLLKVNIEKNIQANNKILWKYKKNIMIFTTNLAAKRNLFVLFHKIKETKWYGNFDE